MLKKLLKELLNSQMQKKKMYSMSSSDAFKKHFKSTHHSQYGHLHYKKKYGSGSFFSSFLDS